MESAVANRYQDDLRRILGLDEEDKGLAAAEDRETIESKRGVAYLNKGKAGGVVSYQSSGGSNGTPLPDGSVANTPTETKAGWQSGDAVTSGATSGPTGNSGGLGGGANPQSGIKYDGVGSYSAEGLIDGTEGPIPTNDPTTWSSPPVREITGIEDPTTGDSIEVITDSQLGFKTPDGWVDPDTPPTGDDPTWQSGYYWKSGWGLAVPKATLRQAASEIEAGVASYTFDRFDPAYGPSETNINAYFLINGGPSETFIGITRYSCPSLPSFPSDPEACVGTAPEDTELNGESAVETEWPSDGVMTYKFEDGKFSTSQYESDVPSGYNTTPRSKVDFAYNSGADFGSMEASADGGMLIYGTDTQGGAPSSDKYIKHIAPDGTIKGFYDSSALTQLRPK